MRFCILPETEELFNDFCTLISSSGIQSRQLVYLEKENLNLDNKRIQKLVDSAILASKNMICIYYPPSPPTSRWFDVIVRMGYENETETRVKGSILKHFDDKMIGEQRFIDPQECFEKLDLETKVRPLIATVSISDTPVFQKSPPNKLVPNFDDIILF